MHIFSEPEWQQVDTLLKLALAEDIGAGDVTSEGVFTSVEQGEASLTAREAMVVCGLPVAQRLVGHFVSPSPAGGELRRGHKRQDMAANIRHLTLTPLLKDRAKCRAGEVIATLSGSVGALLTIERTILNLIQRMSGVATVTARYAQAVAGTKAKILDTRKTMPGMRLLDKYAVRCGGGVNHRTGLFDMAMIKDNHIALAGGLTQAVEKLLPLKARGIPIEVECDTLAQVKEALTLPVDRILLDNMSPDQLREAVALAAGKTPLEASGGVTLDTIRAIAETGVDYISVGALTHSVRAVDVGMDVDL